MSPRFVLVVLVGLIFVSGIQPQQPGQALTDSLGDPLPPGAIARLGTLRFKHDPGRFFSITSAVFSPDGKQILTLVKDSYGLRTSGSDGMRMWDASSGKEIPGPWQEYKSLLTFAVYSPDGTTIATIGSNNQIILWDRALPKPLRIIPVANDRLLALAFTDGGKSVVSACATDVRRWDVATGNKNSAWILPPPPGPKAILQSSDCTLSSDGKYLAVTTTRKNKDPAGGKGLIANTDAVLFDVSNEKELWRSRQLHSPVVFSADSTKVALATAPDKVEMRDTLTGEVIGATLLEGIVAAKKRISALAISPDGNSVAICQARVGSEVLVWNLKDPTKLQKIVARHNRPYREEEVDGLTFSPDGKLLLLGVASDVQLYDVATLHEVTPWPGHRGPVDYLAFTRDGKELISNGCMGTFLCPFEVMRWDAATWKPIAMSSTLNPAFPNLGAVSPEHSVYVGNAGVENFQLFDLTNGKLLNPLAVRDKQEPSSSGYFAPGSKFYLRPDLGETQVFAVPSGKLLCRLPFGEIPNPHVLPVTFSPDGRLVALVDRKDGSLTAFELETGKQLLRHFHISSSTSLAFMHCTFSWDNKLLAWWHPSEWTLRIWDLEKGKQRAMLRDLVGLSKALAFSRNGRMLAVHDKKLKLIELETLKVRREFEGHTGPIHSLAFSPNGRYLASGGADTTVLIWDVWGR